MAAMSLFRHLSRPRPYICQRCIRKQRSVPPLSKRTIWAATDQDQETQWRTQAGRIRSGAQQSMLTILEERGFVKDVAGGREALDWLLTEKPIGAYVGVDPTAPSLHVGHLLPLMVLYWMYTYGYHAVALLGGGTVQIGDPSGRTTARSRQAEDIRDMNGTCIEMQLKQLWSNVKALGIKHRYPETISRQRGTLNNYKWLQSLSAIDLMKSLGSGMRLGAMLSRDSVKMRMESGDGMAVSEFCYPLFQGYDWWHMYSTYGVQLQLGGSDQYGNICAGMDAVNHMRRYHRGESEDELQSSALSATFGLTTPLMTTASGEKFGKSAGNAVWLDQDMLKSFDLYQYFLHTADDDVERYLKLFTFLPLDHIYLVMDESRRDASRRLAQHLLAKEVVELAHGAAAARDAEMAHKEAFSHGTNVYSLSALRDILSREDSLIRRLTPSQARKHGRALTEKILSYKKSYAASASMREMPSTTSSKETTKADPSQLVAVLPTAFLRSGTFPQVLYAAGLVSSKSAGHRLVRNKGAYVVVPNSGTEDNPRGLKWTLITQDGDPNHFLVDYEALILRTGKSKIQVCRVVTTESFEEQKLSCPGWKGYQQRQARDT